MQDKTTAMKFVWSVLFFCFLGGCHPIATGVQSSYYTDQLAAQQADSSAEALIAPYREQLKTEMEEVLETTTYTMKKAQPESTLGGWFSDVLLDATTALLDEKVDFVAQNYGGLRIPSLPQGDITVGKIYELMPFDNSIVILELKGSQVQQFVAHFMQLGGWPVSKGIRIIDKGHTQEISIDDKPLEADATYRVLVSDYIANGGDRCDFLVDAPRKKLPVLIRELVIRYLKSHQETVQAESYYSNRIIQSNDK